MTFNPLEEKGIPIEKQLRSWHEIVKRPYDKHEVNCYSRTRQILMNGIEVEAWNFKHNFARNCDDVEINRMIALTRKIEDSHQTTINWLSPKDQNILETTLGYEQVAVDITAWMAQNEPDDYVKETFDFGLLEDFDHLYRYSQWAYLMHGINPDDILQGQTDVFLGRPTQFHHNDARLRLRKPYAKETAHPQTKVNLYTLISAEQQTHNYYAEHGFMYGNCNLSQTYAEIKDVEEEHVSMYESLIDPTESLYEKLLLHEFTEVCNYYTCYEDEENEHLKKIYEEFLEHELGHLHYAIKLFHKQEKRDAEEVIGNKIVIPNRFKSQKKYVADVLVNEIDKRLGENMDYIKTKDIDETWLSYAAQDIMNKDGSPTEQVISIMHTSENRDIVIADEKLKNQEIELWTRSSQKYGCSPDTILVEEIKDSRELIKNSDDIFT